MFFLDVKFSFLSNQKNEDGVKKTMSLGALSSLIVFNTHPFLYENKIAIGFPNIKTNVNRPTVGNIFRFFSNNEKSLNLIKEKLLNCSIKDFLMIEELQEVNFENVKGYVKYNRFNISGRVKKPKISWSEESILERKKMVLKKRVESLKESEGLPFFNVKSLSNLNYFRLHIEIERSQENKKTNWESLNSYGLSKSKGELWLPEL